MTQSIVMNVRYAGRREVDGMAYHELNRSEDGYSAIDASRSHLNKVLHGPATQSEALEQLFEAGVRPPTKQAETPYVQMTLSASPEYFRGPDGEPGTWDQDKLDAWTERTMSWLRDEYGEDLAHVSLHLDEVTPHMHVLVVPTYDRKPRMPGRQKRGETSEQFLQRKLAAATAEPVRTVSRSSNETWKKQWCRRDARISYAKEMAHLGLDYGKDYVGTGEKSPEHKTTRKWVREQSRELAEARVAVEDYKKQISETANRYVRKEKMKLQFRDAELDRIDGKLCRLEDYHDRFYSHAERILGAVAREMGIDAAMDGREQLKAIYSELKDSREKLIEREEQRVKDRDGPDLEM